MTIKMEKILLVLVGIVFLSVLADAQDLGRIRRLMLLRQREMALRRGGFPFGLRGIGGPGIPPSVAARLAMIERQRALRGRFLRSPFGPLGTPFSPFASGPMFGPGAFGLTGPTGIGRFDLSTLSFPTEATFGGPDGLPISTTDGMTTVGENGMTAIGTGVTGQQGGSGNIFGQQPTQAEEFLETNRGTVEQRSRTNTEGRSSGEPPMSGFLSSNTDGSMSEMQRMSRSPGSSPNRGIRPPPLLPGEALPLPLHPSFLAPVLPMPQPGELRLPPIQPPGPRGMPSRPQRRRERFEAQRSRRMQRQGRGQRSREPVGPRVFPNVPAVVQIPSVTPTAQGQPGEGQVGLTQGGEGQMGGQMTGMSVGPGSSTMGGQITGQVGGSMGGAMAGQVPGSMGGNMGGAMAGTMGGPVSGPMSGSMGGGIGGPMTGGPMGGPVTGPIGGPIGGSMSGPMAGGPMGRPISGPIGGSIGGSMGMPFGRQIGGPMRGPMIGPMRGLGAGPFRGPVGSPLGGPVSGSFGSQFTGPRFSFNQPSGSEFSTGAQTQSQGSAIFPSQATQGPIIRQRGPGFTTESSLSTGLDLTGSSTVGLPGFPNGPALPFPGGAPGFGQSDQMIFPTGGFSSDVLSGTDLQSSGGFIGFPSSSFGQRFGVTGSETSRQTFIPSFDATPTRPSTGLGAERGDVISGGSFRPVTFGPSVDVTSAGQTGGQSQVGSAAQGQVSTGFGFVGPSNNAAAGPAFNTGSQSTQNFNIQFQPLQPGAVPQIPAQQPNQEQMGFGGAVGNIQTGSSSQSFQTGSASQGGLQFGGVSQGEIQTVNSDQNSKFIVSDGPTVVETKTSQQNGDITFGTNSQGTNNAATTVSERTVETGGAETGNTEFRLVEVGNILGDQGFENNDAGSNTVVVTKTTSTQQGSDFQPIGDINTAFRSFESVAGSNNVVDLSVEPTVTLTENVVTTSDATGSTIVTNQTAAKTSMSVQEGPFAASINQDFSFFMTENDNNQAPNVMPPITFNAPQPPAPGPDGPAVLTFAVEGVTNTGNEMPTISTQDLSSSSNSFTVTSGGKTVLGPEQTGTTTVIGETTVPTSQS